jgi:hypothetical protein
VIEAFQKDLAVLVKKHSVEGLCAVMTDPDSTKEVFVMMGDPSWARGAVALLGDLVRDWQIDSMDGEDGDEG